MRLGRRQFPKSVRRNLRLRKKAKQERTRRKPWYGLAERIWNAIPAKMTLEPWSWHYTTDCPETFCEFFIETVRYSVTNDSFDLRLHATILGIERSVIFREAHLLKTKRYRAHRAKFINAFRDLWLWAKNHQQEALLKTLAEM